MQEHTALKQNAPSLPRFVANKASMDTFELPESGETYDIKGQRMEL